MQIFFANHVDKETSTKKSLQIYSRENVKNVTLTLTKQAKPDNRNKG